MRKALALTAVLLAFLFPPAGIEPYPLAHG